jgi:hypothetical protein
MPPNPVLQQLRMKRLVLTVTPGRSGTHLLASLLRDALGIPALSEPRPRVNFVLRSLLSCPEVARGWLVTEKLPAMLESADGPIYAETSHLFCKGLIEPILELGLRPEFIILTRPATEVAESMFQIGCIPERTGPGRLTLLGPTDAGVLEAPGWAGWSDYQLCFWYAREIERRQRAYRASFAAAGIRRLEISMQDLTEWQAFASLCAGIARGLPFTPDRDAFEAIVARNQNPRAGLAADLRPLPADRAGQEAEVDVAIAGGALTPARRD